MKRLLVCLDMQHEPYRLLDKAIELAVSTRAAVHILHVEPQKTDRAKHVFSKEDDKALAMHRMQGNRDMLQAQQYVRQHGLPVVPHIRSGAASKTIVTLAEEIGAGMLIMGSKSNNPLRHLVAGSIPADVMEGLDVPVLLVPLNKKNSLARCS